MGFRFRSREMRCPIFNGTCLVADLAVSALGCSSGLVSHTWDPELLHVEESDDWVPCVSVFVSVYGLCVARSDGSTRVDIDWPILLYFVVKCGARLLSFW